MKILAINEKKKFLGLAPNDIHDHIPNKGDSILFENVKYKVISRFFQYRDNELEIVNIHVRKLKWWDYSCL